MAAFTAFRTMHDSIITGAPAPYFVNKSLLFNWVCNDGLLQAAHNIVNETPTLKKNSFKFYPANFSYLVVT